MKKIQTHLSNELIRHMIPCYSFQILRFKVRAKLVQDNSFPKLKPQTFRKEFWVQQNQEILPSFFVVISI